MDFDWFFRIHKGNPIPNDFGNENQESGVRENGRFPNSSDIPFPGGFSTIDSPFDMFHQMDEMLKRMFSYSSIDPEFFPSNDFKEKSPRSAMLKDFYDDPPFSKFQNEDSFSQDYDIDDHIAKHGTQWYKNSEVKPEHHFYKKFSSIRRVHLPDGIVEEHRVTSDSEGNSITTVRRSIGEKTHEVITHSDNKGLKETIENFTNLNENEIQEFNEKLPSLKSYEVPVPAVNKQQQLPIKDVVPPPGDSSYLSLFKKFFER